MGVMLGEQLALDLRLHEQFSFESFFAAPDSIVVPSLRQIAHNATEAEHQIFLHGVSASGKTHLLHALCHAVYAAQRTSVYLPLAEFAATEHPAAILEGLHRLSVVALDDLHCVMGQTRWEQALFSLINRTRDNGGHLIFAAQHPPDVLQCHLPDLRSRLGWGPIFRLEPPDEALVRPLLQHRAAQRGLRLSNSVLDYLLRYHNRDLVSLLDLLEQLDRATLAAKRPLTVPFVRAHLRQKDHALSEK